MRKTKIICTIGPASDSPEVFRRMCLEGLNVARLNFSHGTHAEHQKKIDMIKAVREELDLPIAIMLDTKGPEYRIRTFQDGKVTLRDGDPFTFTTRDVEGNDSIVSVSYAGMADDLEPGDRVLVNNGLVIFEVERIDGTEIRCRVLTGGVLSDRKSMSFPGKVLRQTFLSEQDKADLLNVVDAGLVFDLRDDADVPAAVGLEKGLHIEQILLAGDERGRHEVDAVLDAEEKVRLVLLAQEGLAQHLAGKAHALAVGEDAAGQHAAADLRALDALNLEDDEAVVHEHTVARLEIVRHARVAHGDDAVVALHVARGERERIAVAQGDLAVLEGADTVLRALRVEHDGDGEIQLLAHGLDHVDLLLVFFMGAVGKIQTRHIEPLEAHAAKYLRAVARRSDGADDLGFSHVAAPFRFDLILKSYHIEQLPAIEKQSAQRSVFPDFWSQYAAPASSAMTAR